MLQRVAIISKEFVVEQGRGGNNNIIKTNLFISEQTEKEEWFMIEERDFIYVKTIVILHN